MVGVYKTYNTTKSITFIPSKVDEDNEAENKNPNKPILKPSILRTPKTPNLA